MQEINEGDKVVIPMHRTPLHPRKYFWYSFLSEAVSTPEPFCGRKNYVNEKFQRCHQLSNPEHSIQFVAQCLNQLRYRLYLFIHSSFCAYNSRPNFARSFLHRV